AEDGRSGFYGWFNIVEGRPRKRSKGCQGYKIPAGWFLQGLFIKPRFLPEYAPVQVIKLGDVLTLATIPGEPTTETGRRVNLELKKTLGLEKDDHRTVVVAIANGYLSYIATAEEYSAQHYEGGLTLYGPNESEFFVEKVRDTAKKLDSMSENFPKEVNYLTGRLTYLWDRKGRTGYPAKWKSLGPVVPVRAKDGSLESVRFEWRGLDKKYLPPSLPTISIETNGSVLIGPEGMPETDHGLNFEVRRKKHSRWSANWNPPKGISKNTKYRFKVSRPGMDAIYSNEFQLDRF
ncbi:MAG: hypothetical protein GY940_08965, partial [bacterium]|nr:hypothetical protein [bacterium]